MIFSKTSGDRERFFRAARNGRLKEIIELSSKFKNNVEVLSEALIESCRGGRLDVVKWLGEYTAADVNYNKWEVLLWNTPLTAACGYDHLDIVKYLVETCRADVNLPADGGHTSLTRACRYVSMSVSTYLCAVSDLDVNIANRHDGNTALHYVVWYSKDDYTQLHWASYRGNVTEVLNLVYVKGHKINVQDNDGYTPLHIACFNGDSDIVESLMLAGADETITNNRGETPAQVAVSVRHSEQLKLLEGVTLWQKMRRRRNKLKLSLVFLTMLIVRLMRR